MITLGKATVTHHSDVEAWVFVPVIIEGDEVDALEAMRIATLDAPRVITWEGAGNATFAVRTTSEFDGRMEILRGIVSTANALLVELKAQRATKPADMGSLLSHIAKNG